jgi:hypothetical protein
MSVRLTAPSIAKASTAVDRGDSLDMFNGRVCDLVLVDVKPTRFELSDNGVWAARLLWV